MEASLNPNPSYSNPTFSPESIQQSDEQHSQNTHLDPDVVSSEDEFVHISTKDANELQQSNEISQKSTLSRRLPPSINGSTSSINNVGRDTLSNRGNSPSTQRNGVNTDEQPQSPANSLYRNQYYYNRGNIYESVTNIAPSVAQRDVPYHKYWWLDKTDGERENRNKYLVVILQLIFAISVVLSLLAVCVSLFAAINQMKHIDTLDTLISEVETEIRQFLPIRGSVSLPVCGQGLWQRVTFINMTDPSQECPGELRLYEEDGVRGCGTPLGSTGCFSLKFPVNGSYNRVCGRARGYGYSLPDAFARGTPQLTPDDNYVDGLSITYDQIPRRHIWTFAVSSYDNCPCSVNPPNPSEDAPSSNFVGNNYFCESSLHGEPFGLLYTFNPLWDGQGCGTSQCCTFQMPPNWFRANTEDPTSSDIEVRLCTDEDTDDEDVVIEQVEIYVQNTARLL